MKDLLFDIGANHGQYTDVTRKNYDTCVLVDANSSLTDSLKLKFKEDSNVHILNAIVSNKYSEIFYISNADQISTSDKEWITQSRFSKNYEWKPVEGIPTVSLDSLIQQYGVPAHVKIDVEGYEYNVLQSLTQKIPSLCFEWAEEKKVEILLSLEYLEKLGFTKFHIQMEDAYDYEVKDTEWYNYKMVYSLMDSICDTNRKDRWGMIWAL
jgi:FkbM family methyltransferase